MKGKIFLVPFGKQGTTEFLFQKAIDGISGNDFSDILYIGPTPRKIRDAQITFTKLILSKTYIPLKFYTIKQFSTEVFEEYNQNKRKLSEYIKPVLIQKLQPNITIGYAQALAEFIREIKQYLPDVTTTELKKLLLNELETKGSIENDGVYKQIADAVEVFSIYNKTLQENNWIDSEDISTESLALIKDKIKIKLLILDGFFYDLTKLEEKIVCTLIDKAETIYALSFYDSRTPEAYALPQEFLTFLRGLNIFEEEKLPDLPEVRKHLPYYVCPSIEEEVETIASIIKNQALADNLSLNRSVVTFSRLSEYESIVQRVFTKYGIPYSIYLGKSLSKTQPVIAVLELLNSIINDYPRLPTVIVLSSPYFKLFTQTTKEWVGYYSKKGMLIKNANEWKILKNKVAATLRDKEELPPVEEKILDQIQREINILIGAADKFKKERNSLTGYAKDLRRLLHDLQWCEMNSPLSHYEPINTEIQTIKYEFYNVLDALENFETDFGEIIRSQTDFLRILKYLLERCEIEPEVIVRGVSILGFLETRGLDCDNLFFGGLSEDKFPGQTRFDPILPEWLKEKLKLPSIERHLARAKFHYFRLINTARTNTFLSFFNTDEDRLLLPSPFLTGECKSPTDPNIIFTEEQKQCYNGSIEKIDLPSSISVVNFKQDQEAKDILNKKFGPFRNLYVTRLEQYPRCPYLFYLENVLELSPLEEPIYEVEAALWGTITHKVLEKLYENEFVPTEQIAPRLEKIIDAVLIQENLPPFWNEVTKKILVNNIPAFVENEKTLREQGFQPTHIEKRLMFSISKGIKVIGRIDRVDLNSLTNQVRILDYKTGSTTSITKSHIEKGSHLQLPIYAFLVKRHNPKWKIVDVGVYSISDNTIKWLVTDKNDLTEFIDQAIKNARRIVYNIRQGRFDLSPSSIGNCFNCDYSPICPIILSNKINQEENDSSTSTPLFAQ